MQRLTVKMVWNQFQHLWFMMNNDNDRFLMHFPDCENIRKYFEGLDETKPKKYIITIDRIN